MRRQMQLLKKNLRPSSNLLSQMGYFWLVASMLVGGYLFTRPVADASSPKAAKQVTKAIEDIKVGDWVLAKDPNDPGAPTPHKVIGLPRNWTEHIVHVQILGGGDLRSTRMHPFWVQKQGWTNAVDLRAGDELVDDRGRPETVASATVEDARAGTFNLTIDGVHTFYVLARGVPILVHNDSRTYVTYTKTNPDTGQVYSGRASGFGTPDDILANRDSGHHMNDQGYGPAQLDQSTQNYDAARGREQQLIDQNGGAQSEGGTSGNAIRGVSSENPNADQYNDAANKEFGPCN